MLLNFFFLDNNKRSYRTSHAKHGKLNDKRMTKPFVPNITLVNLVIFKTFTGIFKHFSLVTIVEAPWFESCALFVTRLESDCNVLQRLKKRTSEQAMYLLLDTRKSFTKLGQFLDS